MLRVNSERSLQCRLMTVKKKKRLRSKLYAIRHVVRKFLKALDSSRANLNNSGRWIQVTKAHSLEMS